MKRLLLVLALLLAFTEAQAQMVVRPPPVNLRPWGGGARVWVRPGTAPSQRFRLVERPGPSMSSPVMGAMPGWAGRGGSPSSIGPAGTPVRPPGPSAFGGQPVLDIGALFRRGSLCPGGVCQKPDVATATVRSPTGQQYTSTRAVCPDCRTRVGQTDGTDGYRRTAITPGGSSLAAQAAGRAKTQEVYNVPRNRADRSAIDRADIESTARAATAKTFRELRKR